MPDTFHEIIDPADPLLESFWLPLYRGSFPADERVAEDDHRQAAASSDGHVLVGFSDGRPVAMARYDVLSGPTSRSYAYLIYMAVDDDSVSRGHGQQMFGEVIRRLGADDSAPTVLVLEVQRPDQPHGAEYHQLPDRRIGFYHRQGCLMLGGVNYVQKVEGQPGVPMLIMAKPLHTGVTPTDVFVAASDLFGDDVRRRGKLSLTG